MLFAPRSCLVFREFTSKPLRPAIFSLSTTLVPLKVPSYLRRPKKSSKPSCVLCEKLCKITKQLAAPQPPPQPLFRLSALNRSVRSLKCVSGRFGSTLDVSGSPSGSPGFGGGAGPNSGFFFSSDSFLPFGSSLSGVPAIPGGGDGFELFRSFEREQMSDAVVRERRSVR